MHMLWKGVIEVKCPLCVKVHKTPVVEEQHSFSTLQEFKQWKVEEQSPIMYSILDQEKDYKISTGITTVTDLADIFQKVKTEDH